MSSSGLETLHNKAQGQIFFDQNKYLYLTFETEPLEFKPLWLKSDISRHDHLGERWVKFPYWGELNYADSLCKKISPIFYMANNPNPTGHGTPQNGNFPIFVLNWI